MGKSRSKLEEARMLDHLKEWQNSGASMAAYCRSRQLNVWVMRYWQRKLGSNPPAAAKPPDDFMEISVPAPGRPFASVRLGDGREVVFHQEVSAAYLRGVLGW